MANRIIDNAYVTNSATVGVYSSAIDMRGNNALSIAITQIVGGSACTVALEGSYDLQSWSSTGITGGITASAAAPSVTTGTFQNISYKWVRVKVTGNATAATIFNVDVGVMSIG